MTPKEKAKELIDKFYQSQVESLNKIGLTEFIEVEQEIAIKSSLIAVEEIIESIKECADKDIINIHLIYWRKVKNELLKQQNNG